MNIVASERQELTWHARDEGSSKIIGTIILTREGEVEWVGVVRDRRREGIATALWEHVTALGYEPHHSVLRTHEGDLWARAVGGSLPMLDNGSGGLFI